MTANVFGRNQSLGVFIGDIPLEVGFTDHLRQVRARLRVAEEGLREEADQRLAEVAVDLATKEVELQKISKSQQLNLGEAPAISTHVVGRSPKEA